MVKATSYILRLSVKLQRVSSINGLEAEPEIDVNGIRVFMMQRAAFLVLRAEGFRTEADAVAFLPRLKGGLWNLALELNIAFIPFFDRQDITHYKDPHGAARNLAKSFGETSDGPIEPVHGTADEGGYTVFSSEEKIIFYSMGDVSLEVSTSCTRALQTLNAGIKHAVERATEDDPNLATAIDLYLSSFYESSVRARFLTLTTVLELLAPVTEKHPVVVQRLRNLQRDLKMDIVNVSDDGTRDALQAFLSEIKFKEETSISRRIRQLVLTEVPMNESERKKLAKDVGVAYGLRSKLVHSGAIDSKALESAVETSVKTVKLLLRVRLGLPTDHVL